MIVIDKQNFASVTDPKKYEKLTLFVLSLKNIDYFF